jgi:hypothetical protein
MKEPKNTRRRAKRSAVKDLSAIKGKAVKGGVSLGATRFGPSPPPIAPVFSPNPPPISPAFTPNPPPITPGLMPSPPPV